MSQDWQLYIEDNAIVAEFPADLELEDEVFKEVNEQFEEMASQPAIDTHISVLRMESPLNSDVFSRAQEAADVGTEFGITDWIIVSEGIKNMALKSQVGEISGVDIRTADTLDEAIEMA